VSHRANKQTNRQTWIKTLPPPNLAEVTTTNRDPGIYTVQHLQRYTNYFVRTTHIQSI